MLTSKARLCAALPIFLLHILLAPPLTQAQPRNDSLRRDGNGKGVPSQGEISRNARMLAPRLMVTEQHARRVQGVNSPDRDNNPIVSADGTVMFFNSTRRGDRPWASFNPYQKRYDDDIYFAVRSMVRRDDE